MPPKDLDKDFLEKVTSLAEKFNAQCIIYEGVKYNYTPKKKKVLDKSTK